MARIPRKIHGALVGSTVSLLQSIERTVLRPLVMRLHGKIERGKLLQYNLAYDGSPDDIFVVTYPKSGTTWLQMIVYQLTTDGAMDFAHIDQVSPHLEETLMPRGRHISDLSATPRVVKSHHHYRDIPKGPGKYIYGVRNGLDVAVSYYHHARTYFPGWKNRPLNEFFETFMKGHIPYGSWFAHVSGWLRNEERLNVLIVHYEELSADLETGVKRIADFCGITIDPADMPRILERCSFAFMREHEQKFALEGRRPPPPAKTTPFIRQGKVGGWQQDLDPRLVGEFQKACDERLRGSGDDRFRVLSARNAWQGGPAAPVPASSSARELEAAADDAPRVPLGSAG
ncbi:MAG TPA: sulfotransferase domain-containing protein [Longimicrobium sp.]|jgi:hypothetical protein|uniref:sulfotransferase domain-containing protein n=1 Tax=Longimicrobium sp. TaxID=2029185 RepID=UPI002ED847DA